MLMPGTFAMKDDELRDESAKEDQQNLPASGDGSKEAESKGHSGEQESPDGAPAGQSMEPGGEQDG